MIDFKGKFNGHSIFKELLFALIFSSIINLCIILISITISFNHIFRSDFTSTYYTALVSFLAIYATVIVISTNLSQEFPFSISLKYIVNSRLSFSYILSLVINIVLINIMFLSITCGNFEQGMLIISTIILFLSTIVFVLLFMNKFKIERKIKKIFEDMLDKYTGNFTPPNISVVKNYDISDNEEYILFTSEHFSQGKEKVVTAEPKNMSNTELLTPVQRQIVSSKIVQIYIGKGKLWINNWGFLNKIKYPIRLRINKYELGDDTLSFQALCEYYPIDDGKNYDKDLRNILKKNIEYRDLYKDEFKEVFDKLYKNGTEKKLIVLIKKYIAEQDNLLEKRFLYSSFEKYFKETALDKTALDAEERLRIEISNLYDQKELFCKSPAIVAKLQDKLAVILIEGFRKIDNFSIRLNTSGLYIKEFLDIRYLDVFKKSNNDGWIREYNYLITNTIKNCFLICKSIIESDLNVEFKRKYLIEQLGNLNTSLEHYDYFDGAKLFDNYYNLKFKSQRTDSENKQLALAEKKLDIIKKQNEDLKDKQSELFYLILHNIDKIEITKDFFEVALEIYNLKDFEIQYYKHERFDKLDWLNYDMFTGGVQYIAPFNFNKYRLLISFYKYLETEGIDIKKFENENFTDITSSFEKELENITKEFISKYFDCDNLKLEQFRIQALKEITEKKESLTKDKLNYIIKTPLKKEYVDKFINDCKEAWEFNQKSLSEFVLLKQGAGGTKIKTAFGQYTLYGKEWFLDSFDKNIEMLRGAGKNFGESQGNGKTTNVLHLINKLFDDRKDKEIVVKDISSDLAREIQSNKEYYLFYNSEFDILSIPNLDWNRHGIEFAIATINNSKIHFCHSFNPEILLFEKDSFILIQYAQGYKDIDGPLVVKIETLDEDDEIREILKSNNRFKSVEDIKQMVKIRVAEKFEVVRNENARLIRIKV